MLLTVRFLGIYRDCAGHAEAQYDVDDGTTVGDLIETLVAAHEGLGRFERDIRVLVNGRGARRDQSLSAEDEIVLIDPISGGDTSS